MKKSLWITMLILFALALGACTPAAETAEPTEPTEVGDPVETEETGEEMDSEVVVFSGWTGGASPDSGH
jgi:hypothetical protein